MHTSGQRGWVGHQAEQEGNDKTGRTNGKRRGTLAAGTKRGGGGGHCSNLSAAAVRPFDGREGEMSEGDGGTGGGCGGGG